MNRKIAAGAMTFLLASSTIYVLLDAFVLEQTYGTVSSSVASATTSNGSTSSSSASKITLKTYRENDTTIYVADIYLSEGQTIQSALANNTYGKNVTDLTSNMASNVGATIAVNGDYYGARTSGYSIRNGELLRSTKASDDQEDMVIWSDGSMSIISEGDITAEQLLEKGAVQVLSFGPGLVIDSEIAVDSNDEVGKAMAENPRTAIGYTGLSLLELAKFMKNTLGVSQAYNLDGGGSSTMYYNGEVVNNPTTNGNKISERAVSDILYVK